MTYPPQQSGPWQAPSGPYQPGPYYPQPGPPGYPSGYKQADASGDGSAKKQQPTAADDEPSQGSAEPTGDTGGSEEDVLAAAQEYVDAIVATDKAAATALTCDKAGPGSVYDLADSPDWKIELTGQVDIAGYGTATVEIKMISSYGNESTAPGLLPENKGGWCGSI